MQSLGFAFLKLSKVEIFFQKQDFPTWMKIKERHGNLITQTERTMKKIVLKQGDAWFKPGEST